MALTVQNLRAVGTGVEPASLLPGQIAFNVTDKVIYVGDGSNVKTNFDGTQVVGVPGNGWYAMPMDFASLGDYYVANPEFYGDIPTDQQVLAWSTALGHPIWITGTGGGGSQVYVTTNAAVAAAPGATTSAKISAAIGIASPDEGNVTIVTGLPDDVYEGLYFFTTEWVKGAAYAYPSATEVIYDNAAHPTLSATVQGAIDDLDDGLIATTAIANTANSTANSALSIASAALPKAGGTMTGTLVSQNINVQSPFGVQFNSGVSGTIQGISDSVSLTSSVVAASATATKSAYDIGAAALARSGGTMTGTITFAAGQVFPVSGIQDASTSQKGVVQIGTNIQVASGTISILNSTTSNKGVVQLNDTLTSPATDQALTARAGSDLQSQIDAITLASNVTLAGSINATTGLLDSVTTQGAGAGFVAGSTLPAAAAGNADYYVLVTIAGSYSPPGGGGPYAAEPGDWFLSDGSVWQYLGVGARPQSATYTTAGIVQLADTAVTYTGTSDTEAVTPNSLQDKVTDSTSTTDSNLIASATAVKAAYDIGAAAIPCSLITAVGEIVVGGAGPSPVALPVGIDGQVLVANSLCATGLEWVSDTPGDVTSVTATSPVTVDNTDPQNPIVGIDAASTTQSGAVQLNDTVTSTSTTEAATANAVKTTYDVATAAVPCASFTAVGELLAGTGSGTYAALTVGTDGQVLLANSLCAEGLEWGNACYVPDACFTALGDLVVGTGIGTYSTLTVGTNGQVLVADSSCATGVKWGLALEGYTCTATPFNTALGGNAGDSITTGTDNVSLGWNAGTALTSGGQNVAVGSRALQGATGTTGNVAVGYQALTGTSASQTTAVGYNALASLSTGARNTAVGFYAGGSVTTGTDNTFVGYGASDATTGSFNTGLGSNTLGGLTSGTGNTAIGACSLDVTTGSNNTAVGYNSGGTLTTGVRNTFVGYRAGTLVTTGVENTIVGPYEGNGTISCNVVLANGNGDVRFQANNAGAWSPDGSSYGTIGQVLISNGTVAAPTWGDACYVPDACFTAIGDIIVGTGAGTYAALPVGTNGQVLVPNSSCAEGVEWITTSALSIQGYTCTAAPFNTALGALAGDSITSGDTNTMVGYQAGTSVTTTSSNTLMGWSAGACGATLSNVVAIGYAAMQCATPGLSNTGHVAIGTYALQRNTTGVGNVAIGLCSMCALTTGGCNTAVGHQTLDAVVGGAGNTAVGAQSLGAVTSGDWNIAVGFNAGCGLTTGSSNIVIGCAAGDALTTTSCNVAIGANAHGLSTTATQTVAIGTNALATANSTGTIGIGQDAGCTGGTACSVYVGYVSGRNSTGLTNTYVGGLTGCAASNTSACGTLLGFCAGSALTTGNANVLIGFQSGRNVNSGASNVAIGAAAFQTATTAASNVAVGCGALAGLSSSAGNTALGARAMINASTAANNVVIGCSAGEQISTGSTNVFIGNTAGDAVTTGSSNTIIGDIAGSTALTNNLILAAGTTIKLQVNENGAVGVGTTPSYGTSGQILTSAGTGAASTWSSSLPQVTAPTASTDPGVEGQISSDATYFYMYTGGRWQRVAWDATVW